MSCAQHITTTDVESLVGLRISLLLIALLDATASKDLMILTALRSDQECPSPPSRQTQGCWAWTGSRLHSLTVVSSDAEAMIRGFAGDVVKSLISCFL